MKAVDRLKAALSLTEAKVASTCTEKEIGFLTLELRKRKYHKSTTLVIGSQIQIRGCIKSSTAVSVVDTNGKPSISTIRQLQRDRCIHVSSYRIGLIIYLSDLLDYSFNLFFLVL